MVTRSIVADIASIIRKKKLIIVLLATYRTIISIIYTKGCSIRTNMTSGISISWPSSKPCVSGVLISKIQLLCVKESLFLYQFTRCGKNRHVTSTQQAITRRSRSTCVSSMIISSRSLCTSSTFQIIDLMGSVKKHVIFLLTAYLFIVIKNAYKIVRYS